MAIGWGSVRFAVCWCMWCVACAVYHDYLKMWFLIEWLCQLDWIPLVFRTINGTESKKSRQLSESEAAVFRVFSEFFMVKTRKYETLACIFCWIKQNTFCCQKTTPPIHRCFRMWETTNNQNWLQFFLSHAIADSDICSFFDRNTHMKRYLIRLGSQDFWHLPKR